MAVLTGFHNRRIDTVSQRFGRLRPADRIPHVYIQSGTSINIASGTDFPADKIIARSGTVPQEFVGKIEDFNINFSTTGTGVLKIVRITPAGNIINTIVSGISNSQSGIGATVFPGQAVAIAIQTAGTGTISSIDLSGDWVYVGDSSN